MRKHPFAVVTSVVVAVLVFPLGTVPVLASGPTQMTVGNPVNTSATAGNQMEAAIAVNPANTQQVVVASNDETTNLAGVRVSRSTDGGQTWATGIVGTGPAPAGDGFVPACCDPSLSWDNNGNLFLAYLGFRNFSPATRSIELLVSTNGGQTWTLVSQIDTGNNTLDQPTVATGANQVWVTWRVAGVRARGANVTGAGTIGAFTAIANVSAAGNFGDIAIGPGGQVLVAWLTSTGNQTGGTAFVSLDADGTGAGGFAAAVTATTTNVGNFDALLAQPDRTVDAEVALAYDRSGGARNGTVYMVYTEEPTDESGDTDIMLRSSTDNGTTWSAAVRVNDDPGANSQFLPDLAVDQSTGNVGVSWHDARLDTGAGDANDPDNTADTNAEVFATVSTDGGTTFLPNVRVSDAPSDEDGAEPPAACCADLDYGDYRGMDFAGGMMWPAWGDNSNSTNDNPDGTRVRFDVYAAGIRVAANQPPTVSAGPDASGAEASPIQLNGSASDPDGDALTQSWAASGGTGTCTFASPNNPVTTVTCTDDGVYTVTFTASDPFHPAVADSALVTVANLPPSVTIDSPAQGALFIVNSTVTVNASFTDAGTNDTHTCALAWDDGTVSAGAVAESAGSGSCTASRAFAAAGVYTITVTVADDDGGVGSATVMVVVYDPSAGFVTGGGWIDSPAGAYAPDPGLTGRASFGFVSRYRKGTSTIPEGNTEFQFQAASLKFHSGSYQWLVVSGPKAQYKGSGTINGAGGYSFLLSATDGDVSGGGGVDKFRIKIWDTLTDEIVYDNVKGASEDIDAANPQAIGSGSIVIHKGKS